MPERKPIYDTPCSKCGEYVMTGDARNHMGDLRDHRVCRVPAALEDTATEPEEKR